MLCLYLKETVGHAMPLLEGTMGHAVPLLERDHGPAAHSC